MQEVQVTIDGATHRLARPFMVIATQNPIEYEGTFRCPRRSSTGFAMRLHLGYPAIAEEARMLAQHAASEPLEDLSPVTSAADLEAAIAAVKSIYVEESLNRYVVALLRHTRGDARLALGASPRAGIAVMRVAKAHAALRGREYVIPADIKDVAVDVLSHRVIMAADARSGGMDPTEVIRDALERTPVPPSNAHQPRQGTLGLAAGLYLASWAFGTAAMYPVAIGLIALPVLAWLWVRIFARPTELRRRTGHRELVEGGRVAVEVEVRATGGPLPSRARMAERVGDLGVREVPLRRRGHSLRGRYRARPGAARAATGWRRRSW